MAEGIQEVYEFLKKVPYYLATEDGDQPRVRIFGTVNVFDGKLYIQTGKSKDVYKQLEKNPNAEIGAFADGQWLRVWGPMVPDERPEANDDMLEKYPSLKDRYQTGDGNMIVLYFEHATARFESFTSEPRTVTF